MSGRAGGPPRRALVVGAGLIGTSVALALRERGHDVWLADVKPDHLRQAEELGAGSAHRGESVDVTVVAVPPGSTAQVIVQRLNDDQRLRMLRMIEQESTQLSQIVDQLLITAQVDGDRLRLKEEPCDVTALCASVLDAADSRKPAKVALALDAPEELAPLPCDEALLRQVLVNLVENALKYSPDGGRVGVRVADDSDRVRIEVRDQGLGIPPSEQQRVFEKFYRLDPEMARGIGGSGLGLYISRKIVEQMDGSLSVHSAPGVGSTFTVLLPRRTTASVA